MITFWTSNLADPAGAAGAAAGGAVGLFFLFYCLFFSIFALLGVAFTAFWIWMLVEVCTKEPAEDKDKVMWILIVVLTHGIGALIYYFVRRPQRKRLYGQ
jgi:hypothetical protein